MTCNIEFKGKVQAVYNTDETIAWRFIKVPNLERRHCDMNAFRTDGRFSGLANSDLFKSLLSRQLKQIGVGDTIRLDRIPEGVSIDDSGFLAKVTIAI